MSRNCPLMVAFTDKAEPRLIYCGKWSCTHCAKINARKWAKIVRHGMKVSGGYGMRAHFWTFTMGQKYKRPSDAYRDIPRIWDVLRKVIQRDQKKFTFIAFVEGQEQRSAMPHFHVITFNHIPRGNSKRVEPLKWIKDMAVRVGFGYQATDEIVTGKRAAAYVAKYASKGAPDIPKGFRRVRCSRDWPKPPKPATDPYLVRAAKERVQDFLIRVSEVANVPLQEVADKYVKMGDKMEYERIRIK